MFASTDLAARIERAEAGLSAALGRSILAQSSDDDVFVEEIGGGVAVYTGRNSPMNKLIGVGFAAMPNENDLSRVEELFRSRRSRLQAEVATLANPAFSATLTRRGYVLENFENVLGRPLTGADAEPPLDAAIEIRGVNTHDDSEAWLDASITGFQHADEQGVQAATLPPRDDLERTLRPYVKVEGFRRYSAYVAGHLAGVASLRIVDALAQLCGAATLPAFRRRGVQTMLLRRRLADAVHAGCELAVMTTQPGSKSQENGHRQGFSLLYSRAILIANP